MRAAPYPGRRGTRTDAGTVYGAVGSIVAPGLGQGFDSHGVNEDAHCVPREWWTPRDVGRFRDLSERLAARFSKYEPLPGLKIDHT